MESSRRVMRRRPLTDCSNVAHKSDRRCYADGGFMVKEVSPAADLKADNSRKMLKSLVEANVTDGDGKENVWDKVSGKKEEGRVEAVFKSSLLSTPPVRKLKSAAASYSVSPLTIYSRRNSNNNIYGSYSCPPAGKKRSESTHEDDQSTSKCNTESSKKKRTLPKDILSQDFIERQRAYFEEIDKFELPEEEVSESE